MQEKIGILQSKLRISVAIHCHKIDSCPDTGVYTDAIARIITHLSSVFTLGMMMEERSDRRNVSIPKKLLFP